MTGYTQPDLLEYPNDYNAPADVPADVEALAQSTQVAITNLRDALAIAAPIGAIVMWPQASAPAGWHLCNGTVHGSAALEAVLGSPNTPDLTSKFIVGAGPNYAVGATGGADTVTLTANQSGLRDHAHQLPGYTPNMNNQPGTTYVFGQTSDSVYGNAVSGGTTSVDAASAHENRPPYYALTYIVRKA